MGCGLEARGSGVAVHPRHILKHENRWARRAAAQGAVYAVSNVKPRAPHCVPNIPISKPEVRPSRHASARTALKVRNPNTVKTLNPKLLHELGIHNSSDCPTVQRRLDNGWFDNGRLERMLLYTYEHSLVLAQSDVATLISQPYIATGVSLSGFPRPSFLSSPTHPHPDSGFLG